MTVILILPRYRAAGSNAQRSTMGLFHHELYDDDDAFADICRVFQRFDFKEQGEKDRCV